MRALLTREPAKRNEARLALEKDTREKSGSPDPPIEKIAAQHQRAQHTHHIERERKRESEARDLCILSVYVVITAWGIDLCII